MRELVAAAVVSCASIEMSFSVVAEAHAAPHAPAPSTTVIGSIHRSSTTSRFLRLMATYDVHAARDPYAQPGRHVTASRMALMRQTVCLPSDVGMRRALLPGPERDPRKYG